MSATETASIGFAAAPAGRRICTFRASDGYTFYVHHYPAVGRPRAKLVFLHGIRSHAGWYTRSCAAFADAGFDVYFVDRRGSGLNTAHRGDSPNFRRLLDDVAEFVQSLRTEQSWLPIFLAGISWGGKLAVGLQYRKPGPVNGLVLLCPGLVAKVKPKAALRARVALASRLRPTRLFPIPLNEPELFTASVEGQKFIDADPHGLRQATARFLFNSFALDIYLRRAAKRVTVPTLLTLTEHDRIIVNDRTRTYVEQFPGETKIIEYAGAHHTLEFEPPDHPWIADVVMWIDSRL